MFLNRGPSHIDTWDMKPSAPLEIRGELKSIATNVPGIPVCELLPQLARHFDRSLAFSSRTHPKSTPACSNVT